MIFSSLQNDTKFLLFNVQLEMGVFVGGVEISRYKFGNNKNKNNV